VKVVPSRKETRPRRCGCGEVGCLEAYTSGMNVAARVREELAQGAESAVRDVVAGDLARVSAAAVESAYAAGDPYAVALWDEVGELLGTAMANLVTLLNPAKVILGGGVMLGCPELGKLARRHLEAKASRSALRGLTIEHAWLGDDAGVVGAAVLE
jgi:glucokinase